MSEKIDIDIGSRIKQIRGTQTQQEFADLLDIGRTTLINYEGNTRVPDAEFLLKLYVMYKVQPLWLLTGIGDDVSGVKLKPDESILLDNYRHCPPEGKAALKTTSAALAKSKCNKKTG